MQGRAVDPTFVALRIRRLMARPMARRVLTTVVALATGIAVVLNIQAAERARDRWGATRTTVVARHDLAIGEVIDAGSVERRALPAVVVAEEALSEVPVGAVVRQPIAAGEPLIAARLAPDGLTGVAALVPEGWRAVAVPVGPAGVPPVVVGDRVDILAVTADIGRPALPLVERATVVDVGDDAVAVAVPLLDVPALVAGLTQGAVLLTLAGA